MRVWIRNVLLGVMTTGLLGFAYSNTVPELNPSTDQEGSVASPPSGETAMLLWGANGHRITAEVASHHLTDAARAALRDLIGDTSLAHIATWPDEIRSNTAWDYAKDWHFITIDDNLGMDAAGKATTARERYEAASAGTRQGNVVEAIKHFERVLGDASVDSATRAIALKFLVHFVGDVHQPLHVGRGPDRGGNTVTVYWFGALSNLHTVWDEGLIESEHLSFTEFADFIDLAPEETVATWQRSTCVDWMDESFALRSRVYSLEDLSAHTDREGRLNLSYAYIYRAMPTIKERLVKGGVRLAGLLNTIFDENPNRTTCALDYINDGKVRLERE